MKNFTNNFKQFTSRLSARWLIMALMLLLGTSSAWADTFLAGGFNNWSSNNKDYKFSYSGNIGTLSVQLTKGTYQFKIVDNSTWYGNGDCDGCAVMKRGGTNVETGGWVFSNNKSNCALEVDETGVYTFTFNSSTKTLTIKFPAQCASCCTNYYLKHPWGTGNDNDWTWKELKKEDCSNNIYTLTALYGGKGCDYSKPGVQDKQGYTEVTLEGNPKTGDECIFTFNATNNTITITKVVTCNEITDVSSFSLSEKTYDFNGEPKKPTVSSTLNGIGDIIPKYYNSQGNEVNEPTNAGTYTVKITVSQGTTYCALTTETVVDTYTINKINQSAISIANEETTFCGFPINNKVTLNIDGGDGDGEVVYKSEDEDIATISGNILTVKAEGTVIISAQKQAGTNHKVSNTATKSFTFYKAPDAPTVKSVTNLIKCGDNTSDGLITLNNYNANYTYSILPAAGGDAENGYKISAAGKYTITVTRKVNETCSLSTPSASISVELTDNTPAATVSIADVAPICEGGSATLTCNVTPTKGTVKSYTWTLPDGKTQTTITDTNTLSTGVLAAGTYNYSVVVTLENAGCTKDLLPVSKSVTVNPLPNAPSLTSPAPVCEGTKVNLPTEGLKWYDAETGGTEVQNTAIEATGTYWAAAMQNGCESATRTEYTITVNPLPTITEISGNNSAVLYEDVELTATGVTQGAEVKWYLDNDETPVATGTTYVVTSENAGEVTVKAKAFLNGCESDEASHTVKFSAEDCADVETTTTNTTRKTKITYAATIPSGWSDIYCYAWNTSGDTPITNSWPGNKMVKDASNKYVIVLDIDENVKFKVKFNQGNSDKQSTNDSKEYTGGYLYSASTITQTPALSGSTAYTETTTTTTTTPAPITIPAVKTVSATSEEGSGIVTFTGKIVKTGCAAKSSIYYGYQFKKADEEWPTSDIEASNTPEALKLIPCTNASATALNYQFSANVEGLGNGNYHFRAYIINGYNFTNGNYNQGVYYGLDKLVSVSTTKTPISNVTLNYCDEKGGKVGENPNPMCKGEFAYMKLDYQGSTASETKWLIDGEETTIVEETAVAGVYRFAISADVTISVKLRNDANLEQDGETPAYVTSSGLAYTMIDVPAAPYISINPASGVLCEGNTATITVTNPSPDCAYKLVGFTDYESGNLTYTVGSVGKYYVAAKHIACRTNEYTSNQVAINQIIRTSANISIEPEEAETTPWEPVSITVTADEGYVYEVTYTGNNLQDIEGVIIKQKGDTYTYYIPRPTGWGEGNAVSERTPVSYDIKAQLKVDGEANQCDLSSDTATITVKDEENEDCD